MAALKDTKFAEVPPIGVAVDVRGQRYDLIAIEPYTRKDGTSTQLSVWMAECTVCCRPFVARAPVLSMPETRRCDEHKATGKAVVR